MRAQTQALEKVLQAKFKITVWRNNRKQEIFDRSNSQRRFVTLQDSSATHVIVSFAFDKIAAGIFEFLDQIQELSAQKKEKGVFKLKMYQNVFKCLKISQNV